MNVYEKLNLARIQFQAKGIKKNGKNSFANYTYFELTDILPVCNAICSELKATCVVSFTNDTAKLDFVDCEKPEDKISFTCPMSEANQKGCQPVQNLGSVQTYIKRYLYQNCFEIAENDCLDATMNPNEPATPTQNKAPKGDAELNQLKSIVQSAISRNVFKGTTLQHAKKYLADNNKDKLREVVSYLESNVQETA